MSGYKAENKSIIILKLLISGRKTYFNIAINQKKPIRTLALPPYIGGLKSLLQTLIN
jgi:hypothetical protein